jgi:hypothetical protein
MSKFVKKTKCIKMKETARGHDVNENNVTQPAEEYEKGEIYEVGESLAIAFCQMKVAEETKQKPAPKSDKKGKGPSSNKSR